MAKLLTEPSCHHPFKPLPNKIRITNYNFCNNECHNKYIMSSTDESSYPSANSLLSSVINFILAPGSICLTICHLLLSRRSQTFSHHAICSERGYGDIKSTSQLASQLPRPWVVRLKLGITAVKEYQKDTLKGFK